MIFEKPGEQGTFAEHRVSPSPPRTPGCSCYSVERWFSLVSLLVVEETHKCDLPICWWHMYIVRKGKAHELPGVLSATFCSGTPVWDNWWNPLLPKVSAWKTKEKQNWELPIDNDTAEQKPTWIRHFSSKALFPAVSFFSLLMNSTLAWRQFTNCQFQRICCDCFSYLQYRSFVLSHISYQVVVGLTLEDDHVKNNSKKVRNLYINNDHNNKSTIRDGGNTAT